MIISRGSSICQGVVCAPIHCLRTTARGWCNAPEAPLGWAWVSEGLGVLPPGVRGRGGGVRLCAHGPDAGGAANELLLKILAKYEDRIADGPLGSEFQECYDVARSVPTEEYLDLYARVKGGLRGKGLEFPY